MALTRDVITISDSESTSIEIIHSIYEESKEDGSAYNFGCDGLQARSRYPMSSSNRGPLSQLPRRTFMRSHLGTLTSTSLSSPSPTSKVSTWLYKNSMQDASMVDDPVSMGLEDSVDNPIYCKSSILVRQDYKKVNENKNQGSKKETKPVDSKFNRQSVRSGYKQAYSQYENTSTFFNKVCTNGGPAHSRRSSAISVSSSEQMSGLETPPPVRYMHNIVKNITSLCVQQPQLSNIPTEHSQNTSSSDFSMPCDIQRKNELCEYLKLMNMNPGDEKIISMRQNRRSSRVKHLAIMSEKKELEKKLNQESTETAKSYKYFNGLKRRMSTNSKKSKIVEKSREISDESDDCISISNSTIIEINGRLSCRSARNSTKSFKAKSSVSISTSSAVHKSENHSNRNFNDINGYNFAENGINNLKQFKNKTENCLNKIHEKMRSCKENIENSDENIFKTKFYRSLNNIPSNQVDFDESIKDVINSTYKTPTKSKVENSNTKIEERINSKNSKKLPRRKNKFLFKTSKEVSSKLNNSANKASNDKLKKKSSSSKTKEKHKKPIRNRTLISKSKQVNKLRNRERLKKIGLQTLLNQGENIFKKLKNLNKKTSSKRVNENTELKEPETEVATSAKDLEFNYRPVLNKSIDLSLFEQKVTQLNYELLSLDQLTPEHIKALQECKKFLDDDREQDIGTINSLHRRNDRNSYEEESSDTKDNDYVKTEEIVNNSENALAYHNRNSVTTNKINNSIRNKRPSKESTSGLRGFISKEIDEAIQHCTKFKTFCDFIYGKKEPETRDDGIYSCNDDDILSEDLEVDLLMNSPKRRELITPIEHQPTNISENCRSSLSPKEISVSSCSLQMIQCLSPIASTSKSETLPAEITNNLDSPTENVEKESVRILQCSRTSVLNPNTTEISNEPEIVNISQIPPTICKYVHPPLEMETKSLHHYLTKPKKRYIEKDCSPTSRQNWDDHFANEKSSKFDRKHQKSHTIFLSNTYGSVMNAFYLDYNLVVIQELLVSFWNQTPLGNILGSQDMWIPKGEINRMVLSNGCVLVESPEMMISVENSIAYVELWVKEHKSDKRERPVADIFITIYFTSRHGPDKKAIQLENIQGNSKDVQYIVLRNCRNILVTWSVIINDIPLTVVHCYELSNDYQTILGIKKMQSIGHYVSSLHNIQDCDALVMGCGNDKLTLCNVDIGKVVATINLEVNLSQPVLWARCDRGFLFTLHKCKDDSLQLIAINSFDSTWKKLQSYQHNIQYKNLLGVSIVNGILVAFYDNGVLSWSAQSGDSIFEEVIEDNVYIPFGNYVTVIVNNQVHVMHALGYLCED